MTSTERYVRSDNRGDQLLNTVRRTLESKNYSWHDPVMLKQGVGGTNSLKELLINSSVEMEATTDTSVTALCTVDTEPMDSVESFERLSQFCMDCNAAHKVELTQVLYPVFVHVYLDLIAGGHSGIAESFLDKFSMVIGPTHQSELQELSEVVSAEQVSTSSLVKKFRNQKFFLKMSNSTFQLLMQFLQVCETPGLLSLVQRYLAIDVYGNTAISNAEVAGKTEQKKGGHSLIFVKPKIPQLETGPTIKGKPSARRELRMLPSRDDVVKSTFGKISSTGIIDLDSLSSVFTSEENDSSTSRAELRERLAVCSQQLSPSPPSLALYTVLSPPSNSVHCACLSLFSDIYACGFADSSVHLWSRLPTELSHMACNHPIKLQSDHHILRGHQGSVYGVTFDSSGQYLLSCSEDCTIRLWDTPTRCSTVSYRGHTYPVWDVAFSPVDVYFVSSSLDRTARLWSTDQVFPLRVFAGHAASVDISRFHCNGKYLATGSRDCTCRLWDIQSGTCVRLMSGGKSPITSLAFSPNGKQLVSGDESGALKVWDLGSGSMISDCPKPTPTARKCPVSSLVFSADNAMLASSSHDNQIRIWNMKSFEQLSQQVFSKEAISEYKCDVGQLLQMNFTHRNCLVAIGATRARNCEPSNQMDT